MRAYEWTGQVAEPTVTRTRDGFGVLTWPEDAPPVCLVSRELLVQLVDQVNELRAIQAVTL